MAHVRRTQRSFCDPSDGEYTAAASELQSEGKSSFDLDASRGLGDFSFGHVSLAS